MRTKLLIVDEHRVFSEGLEALFAAEPDFDPMVVTSPAQVLAVAAAIRPDVVLMDVRMQNVNGVDLARRLTLLPSPPEIIVLTADAGLATAVEAIRAGAAGLIAKSASVEQVMSAVRVVALGGTWLPAGLLGNLLAGSRAPVRQGQQGQHERQGQQLIGQLTAREQQVLSLMVSGMDRNSIASQLHQSPNTVRTYIRNMTVKLGCHSAIEVVATGLRAGLRPQ